MNKTLKVSLRGPYGNQLIYPECEVSRRFADLLGQKTLTSADVERIKEFGYTFEIVLPEGQRKVL